MNINFLKTINRMDNLKPNQAKPIVELSIFGYLLSTAPNSEIERELFNREVRKEAEIVGRNNQNNMDKCR